MSSSRRIYLLALAVFALAAVIVRRRAGRDGSVEFFPFASEALRAGLERDRDEVCAGEMPGEAPPTAPITAVVDHATIQQPAVERPRRDAEMADEKASIGAVLGIAFVVIAGSSAFALSMRLLTDQLGV